MRPGRSAPWPGGEFTEIPPGRGRGAGRESIRFTIEHGHANEDPGRYRGVVFWYEAR
jgi:hypothetical protein